MGEGCEQIPASGPKRRHVKCGVVRDGLEGPRRITGVLVAQVRVGDGGHGQQWEG